MPRYFIFPIFPACCCKYMNLKYFQNTLVYESLQSLLLFQQLLNHVWERPSCHFFSFNFPLLPCVSLFLTPSLPPRRLQRHELVLLKVTHSPSLAPWTHLLCMSYVGQWDLQLLSSVVALHVPLLANITKIKKIIQETAHEHSSLCWHTRRTSDLGLGTLSVTSIVC